MENTMTKPRLHQLAEQMRHEIAGHGPTARAERLFYGIHITLARTGDAHRLTIGREGDPPSPDTVAAIAEAFAVPPGAEMLPINIRRISEKTNRSFRLIGYQYGWQELTPAPLTHS
jgi:hypothetical protein